MRYEDMRQADREALDRRVENMALNNMVGYEFDMLEYCLEKAIIKNRLLEETS